MMPEAATRAADRTAAEMLAGDREIVLLVYAGSNLQGLRDGENDPDFRGFVMPNRACGQKPSGT